ncbi:unnamed protein product [Soboliphyme baturini]|uniref:KIX domain-containing protein n=1 Tax=Soboliphyme baturini TaxID=241478 RepID=A0A183IYN1_9BILA|nr:unnamed protein product [Soboliphyme baturini]
MDVKGVLTEVIDAIARYKKMSIAEAQELELDEKFYEEVIKSYRRKIKRCIDAKDNYCQKLCQKYPRFAIALEQVNRDGNDSNEVDLKRHRRSGSFSRISRDSKGYDHECVEASATAVIPELRTEIRQIKHKLGVMTASLHDLRSKLKSEDLFKRGSSANSSLRSRTSVDWEKPETVQGATQRFKSQNQQSREAPKIKFTKMLNANKPMAPDLSENLPEMISDSKRANQRLMTLNFSSFEGEGTAAASVDKNKELSSKIPQEKLKQPELPKVASQSDATSSSNDDEPGQKETATVQTKSEKPEAMPSQSADQEMKMTPEDNKKVEIEAAQTEDIKTSSGSDDDGASDKVNPLILGASNQEPSVDVSKEVESGP